MGALALLFLGIPLLILYGLYWLISRTLLMVGMLVLVFSPVFLFFWAWFANRVFGVLVVAFYVILYLGWKLVGGEVMSNLRSRGWIRPRKTKRQRAQ
jgi:hypothetical protein